MYEKQAHFKTILKEKGLKVTAQRIGVLEVLAAKPNNHYTAEEIYNLVKDKKSDIGMATVYRTIQLLEELNLIDKLDLNDGFMRYEISKQTSSIKEHHHHHIICLKCGNILTYQDDLLETLEHDIKNTVGFEVVDHEVKIWGYCNDCKNKKDRQ